MPEALTTWRFQGFAHDATLRSGLITGETVTAKEIMVQPNPPRFLREGDIVEFTVKVTNKATKPARGKVRLELSDAATLKSAGGAMNCALVPNEAPLVCEIANETASQANSWPGSVRMDNRVELATGCQRCGSTRTPAELRHSNFIM